MWLHNTSVENHIPLVKTSHRTKPGKKRDGFHPLTGEETQSHIQSLLDGTGDCSHHERESHNGLHELTSEL